MKKTKNHNMLIHGFILVTILATAKSAEAEITMEAAFQGHCGHTSPCEQLCYEIHDGMYECDCIEGYELNKNGYSCQVINSTSNGDLHSKSDEDVLYQKGASFSAKLANNDESDLSENDANANHLVDPNTNDQQNLKLETRQNNNVPNLAIISTSSLSGSEEENGEIIDSASYDELLAQQQQQLQNQAPDQDQDQDFKVNSNDYYISDEESLNLDSFKISAGESYPETVPVTTASTTTIKKDNWKLFSATISPTTKPIKVVLNGKFKNLRTKTRKSSSTRSTTTVKPLPEDSPNKGQDAAERGEEEPQSSQSWNGFNINSNGAMNSNMDDDYYAKHEDMSVYDDVNNNQLNLHAINQNTYQSQYSMYREVVPSASPSLAMMTSTSSKNTWQLKTLSDITNKINNDNKLESPTISNISIVTSTNLLENESCSLDCGSDGVCDISDGASRCLCAFGKTGTNCLEDTKVRIPKFSKNSWIAFPAFRGAYKHIQIRLEFRPESFDGIILLSGERDDLTGDFVALLLNKGFVEFWFDCGSGVGHVRSRETILLNEWNSIIIYRHRWDAWLVLNHGSKVQGRSNGLFSRITFREPVFLGGTGNITGLTKRLPVNIGFVGCIRSFVANEHEYKFEEHPHGDVTKGFDIQDCMTDKCFKYPCKHGGKCLASDNGAVCLCPIGFVGDLCEIRMDLQVPAFNGSSYLQYAPLGDAALIWLELKIIIKPEQTDGLVLYSGPKKHGDFIALTLSNGFIEFAFDLGSGPAVVRSEKPLTIGQWHTIKISRTARLAVLKIDDLPEVMTISSNGFWHLSLPHNLFVGGVSHVDKLPFDLTYKPFFVGCIQKIEINGHSLAIVSEALGGTNIGNCPHACVARPCGPLAECIPQMESYECRCNKAYNAQCNKEAEVSLEELRMNKEINKSKMLDDKMKEFKEKILLPRQQKKDEKIEQNQKHQKQMPPQALGTAGNEFKMKIKTQKHNSNKEKIKDEKFLHSKLAAKAAEFEVAKEQEQEENEEPLQQSQQQQHPSYYQHHHNHNGRYPQKNLKKAFKAPSTMKTSTSSTTTTLPPSPSPPLPIISKVVSTMSHERQKNIEEMIKNDEIEDDIIFQDVHGMHKKYGHSHQNKRPQQAQREEEEVEDQEQDMQPQKQTEILQEESEPQQEMSTLLSEDINKNTNNKQHTKKGKHHQHHQHHHKSSAIAASIDAQKPYHEKYPIIGHKLSRLPTHYESFQTNPDSDILTFDENIDWEAQLAAESAEDREAEEHEQNEEPIENHHKPDPFIFDESLFDDNTEEYRRKQLTQDMERIMTNEHERQPQKKLKDEFSDYDYKSLEDQDLATKQQDDLLQAVQTETTTANHEQDLQAKKPLPQTTPQTQTDWSLLKKFDLDSNHMSTIGVKKSFGACFSGVESYFHYNDAETMSRVISCNIDLNLRIKTHSTDGVLLWTGRQSTTAEDDDYLSLGLEDGFLHFRYDLGSGEADIVFNRTKLSDGLWHRIRAIRNSREGFIEVDGRKTTVLQSPGKLRQLNTDTGLYVGGLPDVYYLTRRRYKNGIVGCISEIIIGGELKLNFDPNTLGTSHNVETGIL